MRFVPFLTFYVSISFLFHSAYFFDPFRFFSLSLHSTLQVERRNWVKVEALNARGKKVKKKYTDWTARIFQVAPRPEYLDFTTNVNVNSDNFQIQVNLTRNETVSQENTLKRKE